MSSSTGLTSSKTGTFYFAFGSNLSPSQMTQRCTASDSSSVPIAVARLEGWKWIICQRGYANVVQVPPAPLNWKPQRGVSSGDQNSVVWGILYNMADADVDILDHYEGHTSSRNPEPTPNPDADEAAHARKPFLQGDWDYNKMYLPVTVTKWLVDDPGRRFGLDFTSSRPVSESIPHINGIPNGLTSHANPTRALVIALVYVDELRLRPGTIYPAYVGRMNRGIDESVALGLPGSWVEKTMRRWVPPGIYPPKGYIGTNEGYVPDTETEASEKVLEREVSGENQVGIAT